MYNGYNFYFKIDNMDLLTFPITPPELTIKSGSNNEVVNLINGGDINILKSPSLTEIEFEARFPMRQYPYSREYKTFKTYFDIFKELKEDKLPFNFVVSRHSGGKPTWGTDYTVSLEEFEMVEDASNGDDVLINFKLKQYKPYGVIKLKPSSGSKNTSITTVSPRTAKIPTTKTHIVKEGDTLWHISKKYYGKGSYWQQIYNANKTVIEKVAVQNGRRSSSNGQWLYAGTKLTIPVLDTAGGNS